MHSAGQEKPPSPRALSSLGWRCPLQDTCPTPRSEELRRRRRGHQVMVSTRRPKLVNMPEYKEGVKRPPVLERIQKGPEAAAPDLQMYLQDGRKGSSLRKQTPLPGSGESRSEDITIYKRKCQCSQANSRRASKPGFRRCPWDPSASRAEKKGLTG